MNEFQFILGEQIIAAGFYKSFISQLLKIKQFKSHKYSVNCKALYAHVLI